MPMAAFGSRPILTPDDKCRAIDHFLFGKRIDRLRTRPISAGFPGQGPIFPREAIAKHQPSREQKQKPGWSGL
jgi:hypothetical protein